MNKRKSDAAAIIEIDNRRAIDELKDTISELSKNVAVHSESTKSLKEAIEKDSARYIDERKSLETRMTVIEAKVDAIELRDAADMNTRERLKVVELATAKLDKRVDSRDSYSAGAKWAAGVFAVFALPCMGYVGSAIFQKIFAVAHP